MIELAFAIVYWAVLFTAGMVVAVMFAAVAMTFRNLMGARPPALVRTPPTTASADPAPLGSPAQLVFLSEVRERRSGGRGAA